jgi:amidase
LVGLKPSRNRITGSAEKMTAASTSGVVSRTVADTAAALDVLAAHDPGAWNLAPPPARPFAQEVGVDPGKLRIRVAVSNPLGVPVDPACAEAASHVADLLADLGHHVTESSPEWPQASMFAEGFLTVWATITAGIPGLDPERIEPHNLANLNKALSTSSIAFTEATMLLQQASRVLTAQFGRDFDLLVTPTMAVEPPLVGSIWEGTEADPSLALFNAMPMAAYTAMFNVTGQPAMSLPVHSSQAGLPVGVQFIAPPWNEAMLIRVGSQIEAAQPWSDRWPSMVL